jgi:hypothetical protein
MPARIVMDSARLFFFCRFSRPAPVTKFWPEDPLRRGRVWVFGVFIITTTITGAEQTRFRNLLELANSSKFEGERANALDAARRLAERHGMTLEEAARTGLEHRQPIPMRPNGRRPDPRAAYFAFAHEQAVEREKRRWEDAVQKARERGLDGGIDGEPRGDLRPRRTSKSRRDPIKHASVLLEETRLPFSEIADITGLSVYAIVGMKLKMRSAI